MISVKNLSKAFGDTVLFRDLSFTVSFGERILISAPSGTGKTTLLRILCGLESADSGTVRASILKRFHTSFRSLGCFLS